MAFHQSVSVAMGTALQHLADSVFVHLANLILIRRDAYLEHVKPGIKQDTWLHLRNAPMFGYGLFPDAVIATAEQDIIKHEASGTALSSGPGVSQQSSWRTANRYRPYDRRDHRPTGGAQEQQPWRQFSGHRNRGRGRGRVRTLVSLVQRDTKFLNDNYCMVPPSQKLVNMWRKSKLVKQTVQKVDQTKFNVQKVVKVPISDSLPRHSEHLVSCHVANHVQYAISKGLPQKKGVRPVVKKTEIKLVKGASFVNHCLSGRSVPNVPNVVKEQGVGGRLQTFWPKWQELGANPRVVCILKEGYTLLFKMRPPLTRFPLIKSGYANPVRSRALSEALVALNKKLVVEKVVVRTSLSFYNRLFLVPKPNRKWRPILDLSHLNLYLKTNTFKMETPETIRVSLHKGEWVTSLDFSDAYFHIPIHPQLLFEQQGISVHSPSFRPSYGSIGVYQGGQRGEIDGSVKGYKNPPVPRRLVAQSPVSGDLPTTYPDPLGPVPRSGLGSQYEKVRTGTSTSFQFRRLPVRSSDGPGLTHGRPLEDVKGKTPVRSDNSCRS